MQPLFRTWLIVHAVALACTLLPAIGLAQNGCPGQDESTSLSLSISPSNPLTSQTVTVTSTVSPAGAEQYEGGFQFYYAPYNNPGATTYPSYTTSGATFTTTLPKLAAGQYYLGANWIGLEGCAQSSSNELIFTVAQAGGTGGAALHGQYAFAWKGVLTPSTIANRGAAAVGSFTADGEGNITAGVADFNSAADTFEQLPLTGTYTLDTTGVGALTITTPQGTQTFALYVPAAQAAGSVRSAQLVETDGGSVASSGTLAMQVPASFTQAAMAGSYAFGLTGSTYVTSGTPAPLFVGGELSLSAAGALTASYTTEAPGEPVGKPTVKGTATAPASSTGRITLSLNSADRGSEDHLVGYVVDGTQVYLMSIDPPASFPLLSGTASRQ